MTNTFLNNIISSSSSLPMESSNPGNPRQSSERKYKGKRKFPVEDGKGFKGNNYRKKPHNEAPLSVSSLLPSSPPVYPCRAIFVRNIPFDCPEKDIYDLFSPFGDIKSVFALIKKRGMAFITFFDLRSAIKAKETLSDYKIKDRKLDVHFSLPKDHQSYSGEKCDESKNQGTIFVTVKHVTTAISNSDLERVFSPFGDIKDIRSFRDTVNQRFIEFYDSRCCMKAFEYLNGTTINGGIAEMRLSYDLSIKQRIEVAEYSEETKLGGKFHVATLKKKKLEPPAERVSFASDDDDKLLDIFDPYKHRDSPMPNMDDNNVNENRSDDVLNFTLGSTDPHERLLQAQQVQKLLLGSSIAEFDMESIKNLAQSLEKGKEK